MDMHANSIIKHSILIENKIIKYLNNSLLDGLASRPSSLSGNSILSTLKRKRRNSSICDYLLQNANTANFFVKLLQFGNHTKYLYSLV